MNRTKDTLATGNFLSVINILMQLRKVCNHPNLFDPRPTISPFMTEALTYQTASLVTTALDYDSLKHINLKSLNLLLPDLSFTLSAFAHHRIARFMASPELIQEIDSAPEPPPRCPRGKIRLQIRTSTATMHSAMTSPKSSSTPTSPSLQAGNRQIEQKYLIAHNTGIQSPNGSTTSKLSTTTSTTTTSSSDGNLCFPLIQSF
jgi:E1A-binding protein p400